MNQHGVIYCWHQVDATVTTSINKSWRVDLEPTFINRGCDRRVDLAPTVNDTMLIHEGGRDVYLLQ